MDVRNIVILTGAGISAESGLATFRGDDGLWEGHRVEDVATPEAYRRDPALVHQFYDARRAQAGRRSSPMPRTRRWRGSTRNGRGEFLLVTQNVDDLHERAGSKRLIHMHGEQLAVAGASRATSVFRGQGHGRGRVLPVMRAPTGQVRPDIVWFGEMPYEMERIEDAIRECDLFVSIGTSGAVYPAAGFVQTARYCGARTLEINLEPSLGSHFFDESRIGKASVEVPAWVDGILAT